MLVALTLDDNWNEAALDVLDETKVIATLFPSGRNFKRFSNSHVEQCSRHEVGNHTFDHARMTEVSDEEGRRQIVLANKVVEDRLGVVPQVFAYPYGSQDPRVCRLVSSFGFVGARSCQVRGSICDKWILPTHAWIEQMDTLVKKRLRDPYLIFGVHPSQCKPEKIKRFILWLQEEGAEFVTLSSLIRMGNMI